MIDLTTARRYAVSVAFKYMKNHEDAEDIAQEAMLRAHRHAETFRGESDFKSWLYTITARTALNVIRNRRRRPLEESLTGLFQDGQEKTLDIEADVDLSAEVIAREQIATAVAAVDAMGEAVSSVFWRRYADGCSETEVAAELGLSVAAVKARAHRARHRAIEAVHAA